jgi:hypothetical protein
MSLYAGGNRERIIQIEPAIEGVGLLPPQRSAKPHFQVSPRTAQGLPTQGILLTLIEPATGAAQGEGGSEPLEQPASTTGRFVISTCDLDPPFGGRTLLPAVAPTIASEHVGEPGPWDGVSDISATLGLSSDMGAGLPTLCELRGGAVSNVLSDYTTITNGGFDISWNGNNETMYGFDFSSATSMDDVAALLEEQMGNLDVVVSVTWVPDPDEVGIGAGFAVTIYRCVPVLGTWAELAPFTARARYGVQYVLPDISGGWGLYFLITGMSQPGRILLGIAEMD